MNTEKVSISQAKFGTRHVQALLMSLSLMIAYGMRLSISVAIVAMTDAKSTNPNFKEYDWSSQEKSLILSSFMWGYAVSLAPSGYLATMWSARKLFSIGLFFSGIVIVLTPSLAEYGGWMAVCATRIVIGLAEGCYLSCIHTLLSKWAPPHERSRFTAFMASSKALGTAVLAMTLSGTIAASNLMGWPGIFYIFGISSIIMSIAFYLKVADSPDHHPTISTEEKSYIMENLWEMEHRTKNKPQPPWKEIFTSVPLWAIFISHCGANWGSWTLVTQIPTYMNSVLKFEIASNGLISSLPYLAAWILGFPFSWLADYGVRRDVPVSVIRRIFNSLGMWSPALALVGLCFVDELDLAWPVTLLILAVGMTSAYSCGLTVNYIDLGPNFAGTTFGIGNCMATAVSIVAPILCGTIIQDTSDPSQWHVIFYITAFIYFTTNLIYIIFVQGLVQPWNNPSKNIAISSVYDPQKLTKSP